MELELIDRAPFPMVGIMEVEANSPVVYDGVDSFVVLTSGVYLLTFSAIPNALGQPLQLVMARNGAGLRGGSAWIDPATLSGSAVTYAHLTAGDVVTVITVLRNNPSPLKIAPFTTFSFQLVAPD